MKRIIILNFILLLYHGLVMGQFDLNSNLISNSQLEMASCGDNNNSCPHFDTCVDDWSISHGTPNYVGSRCPDNKTIDNFIQMIALEDQGEGIFTNVSLDEGCYRFFMRVRTTQQQEGVDLRTRVRLGIGLNHSPTNSPPCQEDIPSMFFSVNVFDGVANSTMDLSLIHI